MFQVYALKIKFSNSKKQYNNKCKYRENGKTIRLKKERNRVILRMRYEIENSYLLANLYIIEED